MNTGRRWPVSFRPQRGEILYSWLARTAGVDGLYPEQLLPEKRRFHAISLLVYEASSDILRSLATSTGISRKALAKRTLAVAHPAWLSSWWIADASQGATRATLPLPALPICPLCLADDAHTDNGIQFLRLGGLCCAVTICRKHLIPLQPACLPCHRSGWPICSRTDFRRFGFVCRHCGCQQDDAGWSFYDACEDAVRLLARFEHQLFRALAHQAVEWCWVGYATPQEFLRLVEDLLWAVTRHSYHSKPIYKLQTPPFPLCTRSLPDAALRHWRFASPSIGRGLLATVLSIFGNARARSLLPGRGRYRFRWHDLLVCLKAEHIAELEKRSWHWPPVAHNAFRRALICRATNASFTRRDEGHFFYRYRKNHADARQSPLI